MVKSVIQILRLSVSQFDLLYPPVDLAIIHFRTVHGLLEGDLYIGALFSIHDQVISRNKHKYKT